MKEGKVFKRILAIALVVVMTITMMPFGVFATDGATETPCEHSSFTTIPYSGATCEKPANLQYYQCNVCKLYFNRVVDGKLTEPVDPEDKIQGKPLGHNLVDVEAKAATCTVDGYKAHKACSRCDYTEGYEKIDAAHTEVTLDAVESTCSATGLTEGKKCSVCGEILVAQKVTDKKAHTEVTLDAVESTCTATGLTEGKKCSVCGEILVAQTETAKKDHTFVDGKCTVCSAECDGHTGGTATCKEQATCTKCGQKYGPLAGHTEVIDAAVEATCTTDGKTEGKHCSVCNEIIVAQTTIEAKGHGAIAGFDPIGAVAATCTTAGHTAGKFCKACEEYYDGYEVVEALGHTWSETIVKKDDAKHGKKCSVCNEFTDLADHAYSKVTHREFATCVTEGVETTQCECGAEKTVILEKNDDHTFGVWTTVAEPTCTEPGKKERSCVREANGVVCGFKEENVEIPALGHDTKKIEAKAATCKEDGNNEYYQCKKCDKFFKDAEGKIETTVAAETIEKGEHKFTKYNVVKDATCEANAVEKATCDVCKEATHERPMPGTMLAHTFKDYKSDGNATCKVDGTMTAVCEMCKEAKDTKTEVDSHKTAPHTPDAAGVRCTLCGAELVCLHTYSAEKLITKTPTCTVEGQKAIVCSKCKANKPGSEEVIPATGHAWDEGEVIKAATCKEKGTMKHKCNNKCGETKTEEIAVVPHNYKEEITHATCTEDGYSTFTCTMCGSHYVDKPVEAYGHMFDIYFYDEGSATCYQDGTKTAECANGCGTKNTIADPGSKTDHEMTDFTVIKAATCTEDGEEEAKCFYYDKCGYSELVPVDALGHDIPADFVTVTEPTCTEKGLKTKTCTRCPETVATEEIPALGHDIAAEYTVDVAPTCTTTGKQSKHCSRCDYKESEEEIPATGHNYKPGEGTTATCTEPGKAVYVCTVCGDSYSEDSVPALGHDFDYVSDGNATCTADGTKTGKCIRCDATSTVADEGSKLEHVLETTVEKASTEKAGLKITKCANCEYEESVEIAKIESLKLKYEVVAYDGKYKRPSLTITDADGNKLVKGEDYILDLPAKDECINAGTYTYTVYFQGDYEGEETLSYKIVPGKANKIVSKETKQTYIQLKWSTVKGADGYRIYVKTSSGGWKKLATVKGTTTYKVKDLKAGTKYTFAVKAFSKSEDGETTIWATEFAQQSFKTLPGKTSKIAVKTSKNAVKLTWKEVKGAEGYRVYVKTAKGGWKTVSTVKGKTTYTIKDLKANTTYEYAVKAYYKDGSATVWSNQYTTVKAKTAK